MAYTYAGQFGPEAVISNTGAPVPDASVTVYNADGITLSTLYTDRTKGSTAGNPVLTDGSGNLEFWAEPGQHVLKFTAPGVSRTITITVPADPAEDVTGATRGQPNGVASLDGTGAVPAAQLANGVQTVDGLHGAVDLTTKYLTQTSATGTYVPRQSGGTATASAPLVYFNVMDYGAVGDGVADDTAACQAAINAAQAVGGVVDFPKATGYKITQAGTYTNIYTSTAHAYALRITGTCKVRFNAPVIFSVTDAAPVTALVIDGASHVKVHGIRATPSTTGYTVSKLYDGLLVAINNSSDCLVTRARGVNTRGTCQIFGGYANTIRDCYSQISVGLKSNSHFAAYSAVGSLIEGCVTYQGTADGDIVIFGGSCTNSKVIGNQVYNHDPGATTVTTTAAQGICVDSGPTGTQVMGNTVEGHYYGIDVKTTVTETLVTGNTTRGCKVGIAARYGEGAAASQGTRITNNVVAPNGGNGNTTALGGYTCPIGVYVDGYVYGFSVSGNRIANDPTTGLGDFVGILIGGPQGTTDANYIIPPDVSNNAISLANGMGAGFSSSTQPAIDVQGTATQTFLGFNMSGNTFHLGIQTLAGTPIKLAYTQGLTFTGNTISQAASAGANNFPQLTLSNCYQATITGNHFGTGGGSAISATSCNGVTISGNAFNSNWNYAAAIYLNNCLYASVTGNTNGGATNFDGYFVQSAGTSNYVIVTANTLALHSQAATPTSLVGANNVTTGNLVATV